MRWTILAGSRSSRGNVPRHKIYDLMTICLLCALYVGDTAIDMSVFSKMKNNFLRKFIKLFFLKREGPDRAMVCSPCETKYL